MLQRRTLFRAEKSCGVGFFKLQQRDFLIKAAGVAGQAAVRAHNAVAGDDDRDRIVPDRTANRLCGDFIFPGVFCKLLCNLAVGYRPAVGDREQDVPNRLPKIRADEV